MLTFDYKYTGIATVPARFKTEESHQQGPQWHQFLRLKCMSILHEATTPLIFTTQWLGDTKCVEDT